MTNQTIRAALSKHDLKQWQLAELLNMNEFSLSRKLRHELPEDEQRQIVSLIENHAAGIAEGSK